jgi:hypothetical protein
VDKLLADLELREDQKPKMQELLGGLERRQLGFVREVRTGALAPADVPARIESMRTETLSAAKAVLDEAQFDLFEEHARRYFDGLLQRASRGEGRGSERPPAPGAEAPPAK